MNSPIRIVQAAVVAAALLCAPSSWAAKASSDDEEEDRARVGEFVEYVEVTNSSLPTSNTIATKLALPLQLTPANVGTVGGPLLYEQDALVLGDALKNVSGLNIQSGSGVHDYYVVRGFDSISSTLLLTDGVSEPEVSYYQMYNVEGVEVFKGPAGFLYGRNPLGGVVNIVRKQPLPGNFGIFNASVGSFDTREGTLDWNHSGGDVSFRLNGLWQESGNYRNDKDSDHAAINPSLTWRIGRDTTLNFNFEHVNAEYSPDSGLPLVNNALPAVSRKRSYQSASDFSDQTLNRFQVDFETKINDLLTLRSKTYYRGLDWKTNGTLLRGTIPANPMAPWLGPDEVQVIRDLALLDDKQEFVGTQFEAVMFINRGSVEHHVLAGVEIVRETDEFSFDIVPLPDVELSSLQETVVDVGTPAPLTSPGDVENTVIAPYVIDQMKLSPRFELLLGARYDNIDTEGDVKSLIGPAPVSYSRDDSEVSPMAGLVFSPRSDLSLFANAGRSYAPPSTRLVEELDPAGREPERGTQFEIGAKRQFAAGKVRSTLALYHIDRENIAIPDINFFTQQSGDQRSQGIELEIAAEPRSGLRTFFAYAYNDSELTDFTPCVPDASGCTIMDYTGHTPIMAPEHLANLWISKSFKNGFGVAGGGRFVDEQFILEDNLFKIERAVIVDASVFYDLPSWRFKLNLKNLTDEEYETRGIAGATSVIPADPFAAYLSVEFRM